MTEHINTAFEKLLIHLVIFYISGLIVIAICIWMVCINHHRSDKIGVLTIALAIGMIVSLVGDIPILQDYLGGDVVRLEGVYERIDTGPDTADKHHVHIYTAEQRLQLTTAPFSDNIFSVCMKN